MKSGPFVFWQFLFVPVAHKSFTIHLAVLKPLPMDRKHPKELRTLYFSIHVIHISGKSLCEVENVGEKWHFQMFLALFESNKEK